VSLAHLQIQVHGENPQALPKTERAKVDDFYAARDSTTPPLPWPSIAPPIAGRFMKHESGDTEERSFVKISYTRPFSRLLDFLKQNPNKALNTLLVLSTRASTVNIRARLMLVGPAQQAFVLAFLEEDAHGKPVRQPESPLPVADQA
jgi:hypothetical protein